jgi:hypothetical protein
MNPTAEDHLNRLLALFLADQNTPASGRNADAIQEELENLHHRQPEILLRMFRSDSPDIRRAAAAVATDLLHDSDPIIRRGIHQSLLMTRTSLFLKPLYEYLMQNGYSDDIHILARITAKVACSSTNLTCACVGRNTVLAWRLLAVLAGQVYQAGLP